MERIVNKCELIKDIKKRFGNFYTVTQIEDIIAKNGCGFFSVLDIKYEYLGFNQWKIIKEK